MPGILPSLVLQGPVGGILFLILLKEKLDWGDIENRTILNSLLVWLCWLVCNALKVKVPLITLCCRWTLVSGGLKVVGEKRRVRHTLGRRRNVRDRWRHEAQRDFLQRRPINPKLSSEHRPLLDKARPLTLLHTLLDLVTPNLKSAAGETLWLRPRIGAGGIGSMGQRQSVNMLHSRHQNTAFESRL